MFLSRAIARLRLICDANEPIVERLTDGDRFGFRDNAVFLGIRFNFRNERLVFGQDTNFVPELTSRLLWRLLPENTKEKNE